MSPLFAEVENIVNLAKHHKAHCNEPDCGVSLFWLRKTVDRMVEQLSARERDEAQRLIATVRWF